MAHSESNLAGANPGTYIWEAPGRAFTVHLSLDVVDRLLQDVMSGFGAVPKRGAEVGGILLGAAAGGAHPIVEIEDYELVPIEYKRGPSYLLSESDMRSFEDAYTRLSGGAESGRRIVGMFRSNTRESAGLMAEDLDLLAKFFPAAEQVALIVRPYATRVSTAGFYFREAGQFQEGPPLGEFPFRRRDLGGEDPGPAAAPGRPQRSFDEAVGRTRQAPAPEIIEPVPAAPSRTDVAVRPPERQLAATEEIYDIDSRTGKSGWVWLPLSFIFLLLGVLLGFQAALTLRPQPAATASDPFSFALTASKDGDNVNVRWDRQSQAIRNARAGVLVIEDGLYNKNVDLDPVQLQTGSVVYRHSSGSVKFTLELTLRESNKIFEKIEWKE